jgi:archaellum component FlaG (FlaF/FlaG flagellin family)
MFRDLKDGLSMAGDAWGSAQAFQNSVVTDPAAYSGMVAGTATVDGLAETGTVVEGSPVLELDLTVVIAGRAPYKVKHRQLVPPGAGARFQPGSVLSVRVSAQDPNQVMLG